MRIRTLAVAVALAITAGCFGGSDPDVREATTVPATKVVQLGGGATVTFLDEPAKGSNLVVSRLSDDELAGTGRTSLGTGYQLDLKGGTLGQGAVLEFPVPEELWGPDAAAGLAGVVTYDETTATWTEVPVTFDAGHHTMSVTTPHFSKWNPFTWDWVSFFARANQDIGQLVGKRAGEPACGRGQPVPSWVNNTAGATSDAAVAVRSCIEGEGDVLAVELVNNRPYGMVLTYGSPVKWGWHETGDSIIDRARNQFGDMMIDTATQLYLPPRGKASVGILNPGGGRNVEFNIGMTSGSLAVDIGATLAGELLSRLGGAGPCIAWAAAHPLGQFSQDAVRNATLNVGDCLVASFKQQVMSGALENEKVTELADKIGKLKAAAKVSFWAKIFSTEWDLLDLYVDNIVVGGAGSLGNGFSVLSRAEIAEAPVRPQQPGEPSPPQAPQPQAPQPQAPQPQAPQPQAPQPQAPQPQAPQPQPPQPQAPQPQAPQPQAPQPQPPQPQTWPETVGGNSHTWTNWTNAGGQEGQLIPNGTTVDIACKLQGFKVANGNTWWYRIASPPWTNAFYVSADAFYNNGATTGPLKGTPLVDPAVRDC